MIFTEPRFLVFFATVFAVYWLLDSRRLQKIWLLLASYAFYAAWDWRFLFLIFISTIVDYVVGLGLGSEDRPGARRAWVTASVVTNLGLLGFFKYFGFFIDSAEEIFLWLGLGFSRPTLQVILPVGISFFTFQTMSYSLDVYRRRIEPTRNLLDLALFVAFFPQLVAGPIVRARRFLPQLEERPALAAIDFRPLAVQFLVGLVKKAVIADNISVVVDTYFAAPEDYGVAAAYLAVALFSVQILCDFSGYSDMAIAMAGMLGFKFDLNFDAPYLAPTIADYWQRWHISLSTFLRDYLYFPLGGNRRGAWRTRLNIMLTMALGGLWHGAAWKFVIWGSVNGVGLLIHRHIREQRPAPYFTDRGLGQRALGILLTFWFGSAARIFFRATDLSSALVTLKAFLFLGAPGNAQLDSRWWILLLALAAAQIAARYRPALWRRLDATSFGFAYGVAVAATLLFIRIDAQPFYYFQF